MIFGSFHTGQSLAKSQQDKLYTLKNVDAFSNLGNAQCQYALTVDSSTPNEDCILATAPNGDVYHFSTESGKTWKQTGGTYSLVNTNANGAHTGCSTKAFGGYLFYTSGTKLGRFDLASTWTDSWQTFTQTPTWRPTMELENELLIGNGKYLASVDSALTYSDNVFDIPSQYTISALSSAGTYVIAGTRMGDSIYSCKSYLWDGFSPSWSDEDLIPENGVNFFIEVDNGTFAQCGTNGSIYQVNGVQFSLYTNIRETTVWNPYVSSVLTNKAVFGVNEKVFIMHRPTVSFSYGIVNEYTLTTGSVKGLTTSGTQLYVSTGDNINKIGSSLATAVIETPESIGNFISTRVMYDTLNGTVGIETKKNGEAYVSQTAKTNSKKNLIYFDGKVNDVNFYQSRITLTPGAGNVVIKFIENVPSNDQKAE